MKVQDSNPLFNFQSIKIIRGPSDAWFMRRSTQCIILKIVGFLLSNVIYKRNIFQIFVAFPQYLNFNNVKLHSNSAVTKYAISNLYIYLFPTIVRELVSTMLHFVVTHSSGTVELIVLISALGIKHGVICFVLF